MAYEITEAHKADLAQMVETDVQCYRAWQREGAALQTARLEGTIWEALFHAMSEDDQVKVRGWIIGS